MSFYLKEEEEFVKRIQNIKESVIKSSKIFLLKFQDTRSLSLISSIIGHKSGVVAIFNGGFNDAEYKRVIIKNSAIDTTDFFITIYKINYNKKYLTLTHRNVLGTLMSLGIKRESIGDIVLNDDLVYFACCNEIKEYIVLEFKSINNVSITLEEVENLDITAVKSFEQKKVYISSLRLDIIISAMYNLSRQQSQKLIEGKLVKVNQVICTNTSHSLKSDDLLSISGKGRMKLISVGNVTSKGRIAVILGKLI